MKPFRKMTLSCKLLLAIALLIQLMGTNSNFRQSAFATPIPTIGSVAHPFPDTKSGVGVFLDQQPNGQSQAQVNFAASHCVGTQKLTVSLAQTYRAANPNFIIVEYYLGTLNDPVATVPVGNSWTTDWPYVSQQKSWFLQANGVDVRQNAGDQDYLMNILFSNGQPVTGFPGYWTQQFISRARTNLDDGVFADTSTIDTLFGQISPTPPQFASVSATQSEWIPSLDEYWTFCVNALHSQPEKFYFLPNMGALITGWDTTDYTIPDGGMNEGFCYWGSGNYLAVSDWQLDMNRLLNLNSLGKIMICQTYPSSSASTFNDDVWFAVGSYLLTKGHHSYINLCLGQECDWYPQYNAGYNLGAYLAEPNAGGVQNYFNSSWGVYQRNYGNGFVLVNPSTQAVTISNLGGTYQLEVASGGGAVPSSGVAPGTLTSQAVTSVTIPAHSARILLSSNTTPPSPTPPSPTPPSPTPPSPTPPSPTPPSPTPPSPTPPSPTKPLTPAELRAKERAEDEKLKAEAEAAKARAKAAEEAARAKAEAKLKAEEAAAKVAEEKAKEGKGSP